MKKIIATAVISIMMVLSAQKITTEISVGIAIPDEIAARVEKLEKDFISKMNKLDQARAMNITKEIYELLALLPADLSVGTSTPVSNVNITITETIHEPVVIEEKPVIIKNKAMSESEFQQLYSNVEDEDFSDDQLSVVRLAAGSKYFSTGQLVRLLELFDFSDDKIKCVQIVYPVVVDKENKHNLLKAFTFSDDKKKVEQIVK